ncbi:MAG: aminoacyl-tRNA hydrolase, partial [Deltaproteobacteria bacterium]|nr:aminoacyl-tRNA hydrolase [Deltaproteobacteria bacterium]
MVNNCKERQKVAEKSWKIIIGLGNPGERYRNSRHNAGFMTLAVMAKQRCFSDPIRFRNSLVTKGAIEGQRVVLAWPQTYMNHSGRAAKELLSFYKAYTATLLVINDDL